eukprot:CAMPEP_0119009292 /NCGR_PEP_ID=MMETSP1176-20130426/4264_1 /TAXON_ID=265551 /ORGANISM="Synedropsis recta cf, Strain CCMP1620" /LENGTH=257 /DNA_ID=CAMNT_0006961771 /DNA_START=1 /DNA_END=774 /DNA_ORIENTATION=-
MIGLTMNYYSAGLCLGLLVSVVTGFAPPLLSAVSHRSAAASRTQQQQLYSSILSVTLDKPLGLLLEEMEEGAAKGVKVQELVEGGSALTSDYKDQLVGLKLSSVQGESVVAAMFDDVMEKIIDAPSPVTIDFEVEEAGAAEKVAVAEAEPEFSVGTTVTIKVLQEGKPDMDIDAQVGDNLRLTLLENDVELYRGLKKKLGNCGGGGQCTFCAIEMTDTTGWGERSDYEDDKIGKKLGPDARMACLNNIQGPATVRTL